MKQNTSSAENGSNHDTSIGILLLQWLNMIVTGSVKNVCVDFVFFCWEHIHKAEV